MKSCMYHKNFGWVNWKHNLKNIFYILLKSHCLSPIKLNLTVVKKSSYLVICQFPGRRLKGYFRLKMVFGSACTHRTGNVGNVNHLAKVGRRARGEGQDRLEPVLGKLRRGDVYLDQISYKALIIPTGCDNNFNWRFWLGSMENVYCYNQCCGSVTFGTDPDLYPRTDPYRWLTHLDPALFVSLFQDANKKGSFFLCFFAYYFFEGIFTSVFKDKSHKEVTEQ